MSEFILVFGAVIVRSFKLFLVLFDIIASHKRKPKRSKDTIRVNEEWKELCDCVWKCRRNRMRAFCWLKRNMDANRNHFVFSQNHLMMKSSSVACLDASQIRTICKNSAIIFTIRLVASVWHWVSLKWSNGEQTSPFIGGYDHWQRDAMEK